MPTDPQIIQVPVDGTSTPVEEILEMADPVDISPNVANMMLTESATNMQANNRDGRNLGTIAMGVLQAAAARNFDELGVVEGRSSSGVLATPIASPAVQAGP